ncbi:hypothetical protein VHEMI07802 [[Torrubiella] hemipterigena]|uniref:Uncharacterized protein n=1 Tax=[Torrubiella] hemipterigena TaxID=1531966 RepID=A0A0A1TNL9_9HYPO|nr:hypothetical protein VHEMI07802 [[Torrubiella] hemipterigena]
MQLGSPPRGGLGFLISLLLLLFSHAAALAVPSSSSGDHCLASRGPKGPTTIPDKATLLKLIESTHNDDFSKFAVANAPGANTAVYFTGQTQPNIKKIVNWAPTHGLTAVRKIWKNPCFHEKGQYDASIDKATFTKYQEAFSRYYARHTSGTAYLVFPHDQTPASGIFYRVELPELIASGKVDKIVWVDQKKIGDPKYDPKTETKVYWKKGDPKPAVGAPPRPPTPPPVDA